MRKNNDLLSLIIDNSPVGIIILDYNFKIIKTNKAIKRILSNRRKIKKDTYFGNGLYCIHTILEKKECGKTSFCKKCKVRKTILKSIKENKPQYRVAGEMTILEWENRKEFLVTTIPIKYRNKKYIMVYLEDITETNLVKNTYKNIFDKIPHIIFLLDIKKEDKLKIVECNRKVFSILGYTRKEIKNIDLTKIFHKNVVEQIKRVYSFNSISLTTKIRKKDNSEIFVRVKLELIKYNNKKLILCVISDLSDILEYQNKIFNLNQFLMDIINNDLIWMELLSEDYEELLWNKGCERILGYDNNDIIDKLIEIHKKWNLDKINDKEFIEEEVYTKDGEKRILLLKKKKIINIEAKIVGYIIIGIDITVQKNFEKKLYESSKFWSKIFNITGNIIIILDNKFRIIEVNKYTRELIRGNLRRIKNKYIWEISADPIALKKKVLNIYNNKNEKERFEDEIISRDGDKLIISWTYDFIYKNKKIENIVISGTDMTEYKNMEKRLITIHKMEAIGRMAGGIAHDFNNLLTVIINNSDMLLEKFDKNSDIYKDILVIKNTALSGSKLTKELMAFSRQQLIKPQVVNLNKLIKQIQPMLERLIEENIKYKFIFDHKLGNIEIDVNQFEQIIINLCLNARDAMPQGGTITIETKNIYLKGEYLEIHPEIKEGEYVMLSVSDTGVGMTEDIKNHIFEPFFTTKERGHGTGLGLSTVYGIVKQNNGYIYVYSEPDQGSLFKIYFPRVYEKEEDVIIEDDYKIDFGIPRKGHILVVEDETGVRRVVEKILKKYGFTVYTAANPQYALKLIEEEKINIDLLLTDVIMPGMSGLEFYNIISKKYQNLKVIYMSGYTDSIITKNKILPDNVNFIQKPFNFKELISKIDKLLGIKS